MDRGRCQLLRAGEGPVQLSRGDFVLARTSGAFTLPSGPGTPPVDSWTRVAATRSTEMHLGEADAESVVVRGGRFVFATPDEKLLTGLLPPLVRVAAGERRRKACPHAAGAQRARVECARRGERICPGAADGTPAGGAFPGEGRGATRDGGAAGRPRRPGDCPRAGRAARGPGADLDHGPAGPAVRQFALGVQLAVYPNRGRGSDALPSTLASGGGAGRTASRAAQCRRGRAAGRLSLRQRLQQCVHPRRGLLARVLCRRRAARMKSVRSPLIPVRCHPYRQ